MGIIATIDDGSAETDPVEDLIADLELEAAKSDTEVQHAADPKAAAAADPLKSRLDRGALAPLRTGGAIGGRSAEDRARTPVAD